MTIEVDKNWGPVEVSTDTGPIAGYDAWKEIWENPFVPCPSTLHEVFCLGWSWARGQR